MPIYEFRCKDCGHEEEFLLKIDELPCAPCVKCQSQSFEKCVTSPRFRLKGQGYYETDEKAKSKQRYIAGNDGDSASGASCQKTAYDHTSR